MARLDDVAELLKTEGITPERTAGSPDEPPKIAEPPEEDDNQEEVEPAAPREGDEPPAPMRLSEIAEKLGITDAEAYDIMVEIPMGHGKHMKLGELKDLALGAKKAQQDLAEYQETADNQSRDLMVQRADLVKAAEIVGSQMPPELRARIEALKTQHNNREIGLLMDALPAWRDPKTARAELSLMEAHAKQYGINSKELEALIQDHRLIRLLRDQAVKTTRQIQPAKPAGRQTNQKHSDAYKRAQAPDASKQDKLAGITALLN